MNAQDYIDIAEICRAGSFRKAADLLGISQPTLSHRVERIERELGATLFERSPGRSSPTALALFIAGRAQTLAKESEALTRATRRMLKGEAGKLTLGFGPIPAHALLANVLLDIRRTLPGLAIDVFVGTPLQLSEWLDDGHIDVAVCAHDPALFSPTLDCELLREDPIVVAGQPSHPIFTGTEDAVGASLFDYALAFPTLDNHYRNAFRKLYGIDYLALDGALQCSNYDVLIRLAVTGDFLTAGAAMTFHREMAAGTLVTRPLDERLVHRLHVISRQKPDAIPALGVVHDIITRVSVRC